MRVTAAKESAKGAVKKATKSPTAKRSLRGELKEFTRQKMVEAALKAFTERGFRETTVEHIVEAAGTTAPTFYRHFTGKDDLLPALQMHLAKEVSECVEKLTVKDIKSAANLRRWLGDYIALWNRVHRLCRAFWDGTAANIEYAKLTMPETLRDMSVIDKFFSDLPAPERDRRRLRMAMLFLMLDRWAFLVDVEDNAAQRRAMIDEFADVLWTSVFRREPRKMT